MSKANKHVQPPPVIFITDSKWDNYSDARRKPAKSACVHRVGPAPREDILKDGEGSADIGTLDDDMDEQAVDADGTGTLMKKKIKTAAASKALIIYLSKMAKKGSKETVDYRFLDSLFLGGANVNATDKHGQTALHEVARNWNVDVGKFFIEQGADVNQCDQWGRGPLHLAAAVDHFEMVQFLVDMGANIHMKTHNELQSPIHFASKYNAVGSLKVLLDNGAKLNDRDYKQRTPLYIGVETAQEDSARYLIDYGAPTGVFDDTGMSAICLMIEKMPHIALDALNQFVVNDTAYRRDYFYLNYLEGDPQHWHDANQKFDEYGVPLAAPNKKEKKALKRKKKYECPTNALKIAVELKEFDVIMHPVMQQLIKQKWNLFGKWGALIGAMIHFTYIMIWTWLAIFLPRGQDGYYEDGIYWKIPIEILGVLLTLYFILKQIYESKISFKEQQQFRTWRTRQLNRDLEFCHPRWPQEKVFIESEMKALRSQKKGLLSDPWNIFDLLTYAFVLIVITTRIIYVIKNDDLTEKIHLRAYTIALISMWLHFMKSCRPFTTLGPFITMLGHVLVDTLTFAFLFFEFFIPYAIGFWILFGGAYNAQHMIDEEAEPIDWQELHNLLFAVWQVTLNVDFNFDGLVAVDRLMAQVMVGSFFALSTVLCLNLYIALLSETFNRVYQNAKANASLLQANTILQIESFLPKKRAKISADFLQEQCAPLETAQAADEAGVTEDEYWEKFIRNVFSRLDLLDDFLKKHYGYTDKGKRQVGPSQSDYDKEYEEEMEEYKIYLQLVARDKELFQYKLQLYELKVMCCTVLGETIPSVPTYQSPPFDEMKPPVRKLAPAPPPPSPTPQQNQRQQEYQEKKNNAVFRNIMQQKQQVLGMELSENEMEISRSWEDVQFLGEE